MKTVQDLEQVGFDVQAVNHAMAVLTKEAVEKVLPLHKLNRHVLLTMKTVEAE